MVLLRADDPGTAADLALVQLAAFIAGAVVALCWIHRANANARAIGARDMVVTPGWAVGWWFVPLANLAMPFVTIREMWRASANPRDWEAEQAPAALGLWWALWLAAGFSGAVSFQLVWTGDKDAFAASEAFALASDLLSIPAALMFAWIVGRIDAMQHESRHG